MEVFRHIPIIDSHGFHGFGHWDRRRGLCPPLDFWGRHGLDLRRLSCCMAIRSEIPHDVQLGYGNMHLDDWISTNELIGKVLEDEKPVVHNGNKTPVGIVDAKNVFEVKLNVSDCKPEELKVKISNGLVSIEGRREDISEHDTCGQETGRKEHVSKHFRRTFTLPKNVEEHKLECKLTEDGHLLICASVNSNPAIDSKDTPGTTDNVDIDVPIIKCRNKAEKRLEAAGHGKEEKGTQAPVTVAGENHDHGESKTSPIPKQTTHGLGYSYSAFIDGLADSLFWFGIGFLVLTVLYAIKIWYAGEEFVYKNIF